MKNLKSLLVIIFSTFFLFSNVTHAENSGSFQFGLFGDVDYGSLSDGTYKQLIETELNNAPELAFIIDIGDHTYDLNGCSNNLIKSWILNPSKLSIHPIIYTPGDNDWVDCSTFLYTDKRDPLETLADIRATLFSNKANKSMGEGLTKSQGESLGQKTITVTRQSKHGDDPNTSYDESKFVENQRWVKNGVMFVTLHITGSRDNCVIVTTPAQAPNYTPAQIGDLSNVPASCSEQKREREAANIGWLQDSFAKAKEDQLIGMVIAFQASLAYSLDNNDGTCQTGLTTTNLQTCKAFENYRLAIRQEALNWDKPILLMHGDLHQFTYQPIVETDVPNLSRAQTFGPIIVGTGPEVGWLRVSVDPNDPKLFTVSCGGVVVADANDNYIGRTCVAPVILNSNQ